MCTPIYKSAKNQEINGRLQTIKDSSFAGTKTIRDRALFTHKKGDFNAIAATKLRSADLESVALHIGYVLCHTLVQCEQSLNWYSRGLDLT